MTHITIEKKKLEKVLEALELSAVTVDSFGVQKKTQEAITAIKQALAAPTVQDEFPLRGILASELKCWHRLTEDEQINLLAFVKNTRPAAPVTDTEQINSGCWYKTELTAAQPAPVPLTDEQILETFCKAPHQTQYVAWFAAGVRFAEAAHGITKGQPLIDLRQDAWNKINSPEQVAALDKTIVDFASGTKGQQ